MEAVVKCGGSLTRGERLPFMCRRLAELGRRHHILVVPGGGAFADAVRASDRRYGLSDTAAHWMAILAMDQYGHLLADLIPHSRPVTSLREAQETALSGRIPVLLPFDLLRRTDPLPHNWEVTSDSISAWIAESVGAPVLILLKDVDGLYDGVHLDEGGNDIVAALTLEQLAHCQGVDPFLATFLQGKSLDLWVISGNEPDRLEELLKRGKTRGTRLQR